MPLSAEASKRSRGSLRVTLSLVLAVALAAFAVVVPAAAEPSTWTIDAAHSHVGFSIRHFLTQVPGRFNEVSGTIVYDPDQPENSRVEIEVAAASIDTNNEKRDEHLRSKDFFDVAKYSKLTFKSTQIADDDGVLMVSGQLKLRGRVENVVVPVEVLGVMDTPGGSKAGFAAALHLNRKDYGIVWNQVLDQGTAVLGDVVKITINVEAVPKAKPAS